MNSVNIAQKLSTFPEYWKPKVVGEINGMYVKLVKFQGDFLWHHHDNEDEMFLVVKGKFTMKLHTRDIELKEGEFIVIPHGVEHCPKAEVETHVLLLEPKTTVNTGNVQSDRTVPYERQK